MSCNSLDQVVNLLVSPATSRTHAVRFPLRSIRHHVELVMLWLPLGLRCRQSCSEKQSSASVPTNNFNSRTRPQLVRIGRPARTLLLHRFFVVGFRVGADILAFCLTCNLQSLVQRVFASGTEQNKNPLSRRSGSGSRRHNSNTRLT